MSSVRWLHLSDLHVGRHEQGWLWPRYGTQLLEDLARIFDKAGPWDAVLFSGDLVNKGDPLEFTKLDDIIGRIWDSLDRLGCRPTLITTPGNHDLSRADSLAPEMIALEQYWSKSELRDELWKPKSLYKSFIDDRFSSYIDWRERAILSGIHSKPNEEGLFPGDASYEFEAGGELVGVISLNSTWLQLGAGDYMKLLSVDPRQLMAVTQNDPDAWSSSHRINFLMTHQPTEWLHDDSLESWNSEINPTGRFDLHLFGHMHEPILSRIAHGGSSGRRHAQSASLFGLEKLADGSSQRIQGYAAFSLSKEGNAAKLRCWPRMVIKTGDNDRRLAPDVSQDLAEDNSFSFEYETTQPVSPQINQGALVTTASTNKVLESSAYDVDSIRITMPDIRAHRLVREVAQMEFVNRIRVAGAIWLVADWGMGGYAFIASTLAELSVTDDSVFRLDCSGYIDRESFLVRLGASLGASFENIFTTISNYGPSVVILDDIPITGSGAAIEGATAWEIEKLVVIIQDYAPEAKIVLRTRVTPISAGLPIVVLVPFDEPDLAIYVRENELGGVRYSKPDSVGIIYRRTDGVPARVDDALRDLQVTSLTDLAATNPDFAGNSIITVNAPASLVMAIQQLKSSTDNDAPRSFELLLALSALPYGEQLSRIRRFLGVHPFSTNHARYLLDRGLLTSVTLSGMGENEDAEQVRALIVPRIVREYVISTMPDDKSRSIDRSLITMYFGEKWAQGNIDKSQTGKRAANALSDGYEISNASTLILRMILRAIESSDELMVESLLSLSASFIAALLSGNHYRNVTALTADIIPLLDIDKHKRSISILRMQRSRALRMLSHHQSAIECSLDIDLKLLSKDQRQDVLLGRGLIYERQEKDELAAENAKAAIAVAPKSPTALQAELILIEQIDDQDERIQGLRKLLHAARQKKSPIIINNILISLASEPGSTLKEGQLKEVVETARVTKDFWNVARATITLAEIAKSGASISVDHRSKLVDAYHFLHAERLSSLFDRCHECLWKIFEDTNDTENLLNLFRHSSFIWRLAGRDDIESLYLKRLTGKLNQLIMSNLPNIARDRAYFMVRVSVIVGTPEK